MKHPLFIVSPAQPLSEIINNKVKAKTIYCTNHTQRRKRASLKRTRPIDAMLLDIDLLMAK